MNYCLDFSSRVEDELLRLIEQREQTMNTQHITLEQENILYDQALETIVRADEGRTMAAGNVRLGELILLIDCDTRVVSFDVPILRYIVLIRLKARGLPLHGRSRDD